MMSGLEVAETASEPPLWMLQLENRRNRQHRLAHEIGAGAPCLKCIDSCPGLDLHFWRKLCRNCRCRKEDHEVTDDDCYMQFEILLCSGDKNRKRGKKAVLNLNVPAENEKQENIPLPVKHVEKKSVTLDWVPPDIPLDLAAEYMQQLPVTKLPITGTSGGLYRKQQLEKQLPRHDLAAGLCHDLTSTEIDEFEKYLNKIKCHVVGQGKVEKLTAVAPQQQIAEVANQYLQRPNWSSSLKNVNQACKLSHNPPGFVTKPVYSGNAPFSLPAQFPKYNLKNPSDFIKPNNMAVGFSLNNSNNNNINNDIKNGDYLDPTSCGEFITNDSNTITTVIPPYSAFIDKISADKHIAESLPVSEQRFSGQSDNQLLRNKNPLASSFETYSEPHSSSNPEDHIQVGLDSISQVPLDALRISNSVQNSFVEHSDSVMLQNPTFSEKLGNKFAYYDQHNPSKQLPNYTPASAEAYGSGTEGYGDDYQDEKTKPLPCQHCSNELSPGEVVVSIRRGENSYYWHPQCFICVSCEELLVDLVYFFHKNKVYCGRHYAEIVKIPRCFACDELIFVKQYTVAEGKDFHIRHFCCLECDTPLAGKEYIPVDNHPICIDCFNRKYAKVCLTCQKIIEPTDKRVSVKDMHWHARDICFCCGGCKRSLLQSKMVISEQKPYCNRNCVSSALVVN